MTSPTINRPRRLRTVAALALGFTAIPGAALAVAGDAIPGDPFKLGQENRISAASSTIRGSGQGVAGVLQVRRDGAGPGPALKVIDHGGGTKRAVDIQVDPGQSPLGVNPEAGKATNLNADKLDGRDEVDFLPSRLYGNTTGPVKGEDGNGKTVLLTALNGLKCDDGDVAISGGGNAVDDDDDLNSIVPFRSSYQIEFQDNGKPGLFRADIICADSARPFR